MNFRGSPIVIWPWVVDEKKTGEILLQVIIEAQTLGQREEIIL